MLGYNLLEGTGVIYWQALGLMVASAITAFTGTTILEEEESLNTTVGGKKLTHVRRYKIVDGKLKVSYEDYWFQNRTLNAYSSIAPEYTPHGTEWKWLSCKKEWGFSEEMPDPPVFEFMSDGMKEIANEIIKNK